jgi:hypothetical protein
LGNLNAIFALKFSVLPRYPSDTHWVPWVKKKDYGVFENVMPTEVGVTFLKKSPSPYYIAW